MPNPRHLDFAVNQIQDNIGLINMSDPKHLDLAGNQVQYSMGLVKISDLRYLNLAINQVQNKNYTPLGTPKRMITLF